MKLVIKTADIEIEYQDDCSALYKDAREQIELLIKTMHSARPMVVHSAPIVGTVEEIFNKKK